MTSSNKTFKAVVVAIAFFSMWGFIMHSSLLFGVIGAICIALLYMENDTYDTDDNE